MVILETINISKAYNNIPAVSNADLTVKQGEITALIGENGAGKTTLMRIITSLTKPDSGEVLLFGESAMAKKRMQMAKMGCLIEYPALYLNMSGEQNLEYYRIQRRIDNKNIVKESLKRVGLADTKAKRVKDYSLGMKQRLGIALAMLNKSELLILDEPANGLDPTGIIEMRELLKQLSNEGIGMLVSSHQLTELAKVSDKFIFMHYGSIKRNVTKEQLFHECSKFLLLEVDDAKKAEKALIESLGLTQFEIHSPHEMRINDKNIAPHEVVRVLVYAGVKVSSVTSEHSSLEDCYMKTIQGVY